MKNFLVFFVMAMVLGLSACGTPTTSRPNPEPMPPVACTMDAKICPDGSAVGRIAPDCEFAPCPGEEK